MNAFYIALLGSIGAIFSQAAGPEVRREALATSPTEIHYRTVQIDGLNVFYREAGPPDGPAVLLLHGFPTSSHMFRTLIPLLATSYRVVAPDYPGFGYSSMPDRSRFAYTFDNLATIVDRFTERVGLPRYALYVMDYGAPVGYRLAMRHPERVSALVVQNGNTYQEGLTDFWKPLRQYWTDPAPANRNALRKFLEPESTRWQYTHGVPDTTKVSPDGWTLDQIGLDRAGNAEIQLDLFFDYRRNLDLYPKVQEYFRVHRPPALIVWGKNDIIFPVAGALPYKRDLPDAELHLLDTGHFALETHAGEIAALMHDFLRRNVTRN